MALVKYIRIDRSELFVFWGLRKSLEGWPWILAAARAAGRCRELSPSASVVCRPRQVGEAAAHLQAGRALPGPGRRQVAKHTLDAPPADPTYVPPPDGGRVATVSRGEGRGAHGYRVAPGWSAPDWWSRSCGPHSKRPRADHLGEGGGSGGDSEGGGRTWGRGGGRGGVEVVGAVGWSWRQRGGLCLGRSKLRWWR